MSLEKMKKSIHNIYGWKTVDGVPKLEMDLPEFVKERIEYFRGETEHGLTFTGYLNAVLGHTELEKENKDIFELGASIDWLPASEEFKNWRDEFTSMRQIEIATAIIYGGYEWEKKDE